MLSITHAHAVQIIHKLEERKEERKDGFKDSFSISENICFVVYLLSRIHLVLATLYEFLPPSTGFIGYSK